MARLEKNGVTSRSVRAGGFVILVLAAAFLVPSLTMAETGLEAIREEVDRLRKDYQAKQRQILELEEQLHGLQGRHLSPRQHNHGEEHEHAHEGHETRQQSGWLPNGQLQELSLVSSFSAGCGTEHDEVIAQLQGGAHDPDRCGFSFQSAELNVSGTLDPHLQILAHVLFSEGHVEVEEVFAATDGLPYGLQLKGGYFLTEFGQLNASHPHSWAWLDQPVINSRLLGEDGLRGSGMRLGWITPTPWYSQLLLGIQNANDSSMTSFRGSGHGHGHGEGTHHAEHEHEHEHAVPVYEGVGGSPVVDQGTRSLNDLLYLVRWEHGWAPSVQTTMKWGVSGLFGPNRSGRDSQTRIYGTDLTLQWLGQTGEQSGPLLTWQTELMWRDYEVGPWGEEALQIRETGLEDWGLYSQLLYALHPAWAIGIRYEYASGRRELPMLARQDDPLRGDRQRISPLLIWSPTHSTRFRLQYNYDDVEFLQDRSHTLWLGFEFMLGTYHDHPH